MTPVREGTHTAAKVSQDSAAACARVTPQMWNNWGRGPGIQYPHAEYLVDLVVSQQSIVIFRHDVGRVW